MKFDKKFHKLYFLMKAYWYGSDILCINIPEYDEWSIDYIFELIHDYDGECTISAFEKYVNNILDERIKLYINMIK